MATRMNMMKLLQEVRGFADFANKRAFTRPLGPLLLRLIICPRGDHEALRRPRRSPMPVFPDRSFPARSSGSPSLCTLSLSEGLGLMEGRGVARLRPRALRRHVMRSFALRVPTRKGQSLP